MKKSRAVDPAFSFLIQFPIECTKWELHLILNKFKLHPESPGCNPNNFTVGANRDFKIGEEKALGDLLFHSKLMPGFNKGTVNTDVSHDTFVLLVVDQILSNYRTWHAGVSALVPFFPGI